MRDWIDWSTLGFGLGALAMIGALVALLVWESNQWQEFKVAHNCKAVSHIKGDVFITTSINPQGQVIPGVSSTPDKTGWLCDDGITYFR